MVKLKVEILDARVDFVDQPFLKPLIISSGAISELSQATAEVTVCLDGRRAGGRGSMYLSDLWAWPDQSLTPEQRDAQLRRLCKEIAKDLPQLCGAEPAHPLELGLRLHENVCRQKSPPVLARTMCASPFDAAIHDAVGIALNKSAFEFYGDDVSLPTADPYFADGKTSAAIARMIQPPKRWLWCWYLVGKNDTQEDLVPWIRQRGYRCFKIKILGQDMQYDVDRTVDVFRMVKSLGVESPWLTVDTNEASPDACSVLDYLERLKAADTGAFQALQYFEQPTGRDILVHKYDWREVTKLKPVMLDEGLTSLELMEEALDQGWSGFALKTCKGHSFALVAAAWAKEHGLMVSLQDLTNPGLSMIHAALFAAHVPTVNDVELNSPQFTPAANKSFLPRLAGLFDPKDGIHRLPVRVPVGLGSVL